MDYLLLSEIVLYVKPLTSLLAMRAQYVAQRNHLKATHKSRFEHRAMPYLRSQIARLDEVIANRRQIGPHRLAALRLRLKVELAAGLEAEAA